MEKGVFETNAVPGNYLSISLVLIYEISMGSIVNKIVLIFLQKIPLSPPFPKGETPAIPAFFSMNLREYAAPYNASTALPNAVEVLGSPLPSNMMKFIEGTFTTETCFTEGLYSSL